MRQVFVSEEIFPERQIETTKANGQSDKLLVIGMTIACAGSTMFAEMIGKTAESFKNAGCDKGTVIAVNLDFQAKEWKMQNGGTGHGTNVRIMDFTIICKV